MRKAGKNQLAMPFGGAQSWRPIHYLGSKLRVTGQILEACAQLVPPGGTVCDLFAGSGTVSLALADRWTVIASDIQEYSRAICSALLLPEDFLAGTAEAHLTAAQSGVEAVALRACVQPLIDAEEAAIAHAERRPEPLCDIIEHGSLLSIRGATGSAATAMAETCRRMDPDLQGKLLATRYFGGIYFSYRQALDLDCLLLRLQNMPRRSHDTWLAAILSTASDLVNTVGKQFAQPLRPRRADGSIKMHLIKQMVRDRTESAFPTFRRWLERYTSLVRGGSHRVLRADYREAMREINGVDLVYADPPYTRDHYSRYYHVLETLSLRDHPEVSASNLHGGILSSRGVYRKQRHQSPFCIKSLAPQAFSELFEGCRSLGAPMLLSYSPYVKDGHPRLLTVDAVRSIAKRFFGRIEIREVTDIAHSKLNKTDRHLEAASNAEVLITCLPR